MRRTAAIALNTYRETIRDRVVWVIFGFALLLVLASNLIAFMGTPDRESDPMMLFHGIGIKIIGDVGLSGIWALSALIAVFIGTGMIHKEIDKRTVYTVLARPVLRAEFILGKYLGLLATIALLMAGMAAFFLGHYALSGGNIDLALGQALLMTFVEIAVITALAVCFGALGSPVLSAIMTFFAALAGHMAPDIVELTLIGGFESLRGPFYVAYLLVPHLHLFNLRDVAVHHEPQAFGLIAAHIGYAFILVVCLLGVSLLAFRRRNL